MHRARCPYWQDCENYNQFADICQFSSGYYGNAFKADDCFKEKEECPE